MRRRNRSSCRSTLQARGLARFKRQRAIRARLTPASLFQKRRRHINETSSHHDFPRSDAKLAPAEVCLASHPASRALGVATGPLPAELRGDQRTTTGLWLGSLDCDARNFACIYSSSIRYRYTCGTRDSKECCLEYVMVSYVKLFVQE